MIGAIIGDIVGSRFEFNNHRSKDFELFTEECFITDDSIMTLAVAKAIMETEKERKMPFGLIHSDFAYLQLLQEKTVQHMQEIGRHYPHCGYGGRFHSWIFSSNPKPYNSYGNGAAMRISCAGFSGRTESEVFALSETITGVSHDHEEGLKGAEAAALCIFMARRGLTKTEIRRRITEDYYPLEFTIDEIRDTYEFNETCQDTVPQAIEAFLESTSFEDAIRTAISVGGDSDTLAAITGAMAEAYYGVPSWIREKALTYLDERLYGIYEAWQSFLGFDACVSTYHLLTKYIGKIQDLLTLNRMEVATNEEDPMEDEYRRPLLSFTDLSSSFISEFLEFLESRLAYQYSSTGSISTGEMLPWEHDSLKYIHCEKMNPDQILSILLDTVKAHKNEEESFKERITDGSLMKLLKCLKAHDRMEEPSVVEEIIFEIGGFFTGRTRYHLKFKKDAALFSKTNWLEEPETTVYSEAIAEKIFFAFEQIQVSLWNYEYIDPYILDGTDWTLSVKYKGHRGTVWSGLHAFPPNWDHLLHLFKQGPAD